MASLENEGLTIEYEVFGEGQPILFILGLGGQLIDLPTDFIDLLVQRDFKVIVFDNRDVGLSSRASDWTPPPQEQTLRYQLRRHLLKGVGYTMVDMARDAAGLLNKLGLDSVHVVGISMGGMIAQELAIGYPEKVRSLCSIMSNTGDRRRGIIHPTLLTKLVRWPNSNPDTAIQDMVDHAQAVSGPHFDPEAYGERAKISFERSFDPIGVARQAAAIAGTRDRTSLLGSVDVPTLVIHGLLDQLVLPSGGHATTKAIAESRLLVFPDMAHDLPESRWLEIVEAIAANTKRSLKLAV